MFKFLSIQFLKLCKLTNKWGDLLYAVACDNIPYCTYRSPFKVLNEQTNGAPLKDFRKKKFLEKLTENLIRLFLLYQCPGRLSFQHTYSISGKMRLSSFVDCISAYTFRLNEQKLALFWKWPWNDKCSL